ncbi:MAG: hypothetical protein JRM85_08375 [Nitrososphaerota archaeon]|nr:hypothetical protein [Nitrososphaerota archaeon]
MLQVALEEDDGRPAQRRSRAEMACDLMLAISKGAVRPTKIMQRANLTWNALLVYLNSLAVNGLVRREERGNVSTYHLTEKGAETLQAYLMLKERLRPLALETTDLKSMFGKLRPPAPSPAAAPDVKALVDGLKGGGWTILAGSVTGKSGVTHSFDVVAKDRSGGVHGYVFAGKPDEKLVLSLFMIQLDTDVKVHIAHAEEPERGAAERAKEYGIEMDRHPFRQTGRGGLA